MFQSPQAFSSFRCLALTLTLLPVSCLSSIQQQQPPPNRRQAAGYTPSQPLPDQAVQTSLPLPVGAVAGGPITQAQPLPTSRPKKGLGMWGTSGDKGASIGANWYYNWRPSPNMGSSGSLEFVPMIWGPRDDNDESYAALRSAASPYALGPNEPDQGGDGNRKMSPEDVIAIWPKLIATGKQLGSPSVAGDYQWLESFMQQAAARSYRVDFIAVHKYPNGQDMSDVETVRKFLTDLYSKYHKPLWLTEFGFCSWATQGGVSDSQKQAFIASFLAMLESLPFVERYAWFSDRSFSGCEDSAIFDGGGSPTATGRAYHAAGAPPAAAAGALGGQN